MPTTLEALHASDIRVDGLDFRPVSAGDADDVRDHGARIRRGHRAHRARRPRLADALITPRTVRLRDTLSASGTGHFFAYTRQIPGRKTNVGRALSPVVAALIAVSSVPALLGQTPDAAQVMASAREALGGEKKLSAVRSFVATGRTRQIRGNNLVPIEFEINCELPDKFVRKDEIPAQDTDPTTRGFNGDTLIQFPPPGAGRGGPRAGGPGPGGPPPGGPPPGGGARAGGPPPAGGRGPGGPPVPPIVAVKQDFARLMLGMFAASFPSFPLTFKYAAVGEAPEGKADVLDVAGPANLVMRFVVQRDTHLPVMLMWNGPGARDSRLRPSSACISPTIGMSTGSSCRSASAGRLVPTRSKRRPSIAFGSTRKSIRESSRCRNEDRPVRLESCCHLRIERVRADDRDRDASRHRPRPQQRDHRRRHGHRHRR